MVESTVDYPAGRDAGHRVEWEEDRLLDGIMAAIGAGACEAPAVPVDGGTLERLKDAVEGECEGLAISDDQAAAIMAHIATPSVSVESEERKPWPKGCIGYMPDYQAGGDCVNCGRVREDHAEFAAPAPNPSPDTKSGEAVREALRKIADEAAKANDVIRLNRDGGGQGRVKVATAMHRIAEWSRAAFALAAPSPQPANAVREAAADRPRTVLAEGCCSASSPCGHQKRDPTTICEVCTLAALTEPAPAGEAVEPVRSVAWRLAAEISEAYENNATQAEATNMILAAFAHPAPEDTARLREEDADFAAIGRSFMASFEAIVRSEGRYNGYAPAEDPAELVNDLFHDMEDAERDRDDARKALIEARTWHEAQDKALSKSGRGDAGYYWSRAQHQEQIAEINAALKVDDGRDADKAGPGASDDGPDEPASVSGA